MLHRHKVKKDKTWVWKQGLTNAFLMHQTVNIFRITGDTFSVTDIVFCHCSVEAATNNMKMNRQSYGAKKLQNQVSSPQAVTLPIPGIQIMTIYKKVSLQSSEIDPVDKTSVSIQ